MTPPAKFPDDSYDAIERKYGLIISNSFPKYAEFWEFFIGRDVSSTSMRWYRVKFPKSFGQKNRREFYWFREEVSMAHYSLFCNLAGAYFHFDELKRMQGQPITQEVYFKHWEHFECFYLRLGGCFYQVFHLWDRLSKLFHIKREQFLKSGKLQTKWKKFSDFHHRFSVMRDNLTHYSRGASQQLKDGFLIPRTVKEGNVSKNKMELWSTQLRRKVWQRTDAKMYNDLVKCLEMFNYIHGIYIQQFAQALIKKGLCIERK
ncbi:MAG: hypothetical protein HYS55_02575 [Candidatus Omnitrophica bacterium]|nr:hypothetical protein [Candidatus Omnitrophota bacterium]